MILVGKRSGWEILNRSNFTCEDCRAADKTLHVHHCLYYPDTEPWDYADDHLRALCEDCHESRGINERSITTAVKFVMARMTGRQLDELALTMPDIVALDDLQPMLDALHAFRDPNLGF